MADPADQVRQRWPDFQCTERQRSIKCQLLHGRINAGQEPVIVKALDHQDPVWHWYFQHEIKVLPQLPQSSGLRLIDASAEQQWLMLRRLPGQLWGPWRRVTLASLRQHHIKTVNDQLEDMAGWGVTLECTRDSALDEAFRQRFLEDPSRALDWFLEGFDTARDYDFIDAEAAKGLKNSLRDYPVTTFNHGDLLPRNIISEGRRVTFIDWECAGEHARDWDRALLWAGLDGELKDCLEQPARDSTDPGRFPAFLALGVFAHLRELKFCSKRSRRRADVQDRLSAALSRFQALTTDRR